MMLQNEENKVQDTYPEEASNTLWSCEKLAGE